MASRTIKLSDTVGRHHAARDVNAWYDSAQTTDDNRRMWAGADGFSPDAVASIERRRVLRNRARYEYRNGSYCKGIVETLANDCVGTGPELQLLTGDKALNRAIQDEFWEWYREVALGEKLWQMRAARAHSGEVFGLLATNPGLRTDVKLDVTLAEAEQVTAPYVPDATVYELDGIEFDVHGNRAAYNVLKHHPGDTHAMGMFRPNDFVRWPARYVLHYYKADRPGQRRGVPDITPALQLFGELRRYTAAVIAAAETAADYAMAIQTDAPPNEQSDLEVDPMDTIELQRRMATVLPEGYKLTQTKAEQPVTGYAEFVDAKLAEIARCIGMPFTIAALSSAKANMSAAYLDGQRYAQGVHVDRHRMEQQALDPMLDEWLTEWVRIRRPAAIPDRFPRAWRWPDLGHHADPAKVANAAAVELASGMGSIPRLMARRGLDWEAEQQAAAESLGITVDEYRKLLREKLIGNPNAAAANANRDANAND